MVNLLYVVIAASLGLLVYIGVPFLAGAFDVRTRQSVGRFYAQLAARSLKQFAFVRRVLSGYDVMPIHVDDEQKLLKVTLQSSMTGDDTEYRFADPDSRIKRLFNKPVAVCYENVPAAVDAELAEIGHWVREKRIEEGLYSGDPAEDGLTVDPWVRMPDTAVLSDPIDAMEIVPNSVQPETIKTTEQLTRERHRLYNDGLDIKDELRVLIAFAVGVGAVALMRYVDVKILDGAGGGGGIPNPVGNHTIGMVVAHLPGVLA